MAEYVEELEAQLVGWDGLPLKALGMPQFTLLAKYVCKPLLVPFIGNQGVS